MQASEPGPQMFERQFLPRFLFGTVGIFTGLFGYGFAEAAADRGVFGASYLDGNNDWAGPGVLVALALFLSLLVVGFARLAIAMKWIPRCWLQQSVAVVSRSPLLTSLLALFVIQTAVVVVMEICESHGVSGIRTWPAFLGGPLLLVLGFQVVLAHIAFLGVMSTARTLTRAWEALRDFVALFVTRVRADVGDSVKLLVSLRSARTFQTLLLVRFHGLRGPPALAA